MAFMTSSKSATNQWDGMPTLRCGIDPEELGYHARVVGVVGKPNNFQIGDRVILSPGEYGFCTRASATQGLVVGFGVHAMRDDI